MDRRRHRCKDKIGFPMREQNRFITHSSIKTHDISYGFILRRERNKRTGHEIKFKYLAKIDTVLRNRHLSLFFNS
jgi:hypothetical protein